ncbi:MAG: DUF3859 domain-containing protein [Gomphosphaeria aponina SAG 52.96 = DSM 107014]|uniref:DUF3859 domain-containing protein n=1 Tax=Gomphosphaeria aponina SAG 52.96 = DSM 107014 TaxID=1521640 RepID=A0A941GQB4_9CHRO|nr:DUF3859 domain-containing protein [Gomphosphaeria aponina SAG 52.96 = DSM 107014]
MKEPIKQEQLTQIVAEVEQLAKLRENQLSRSLVEEILAELNLPNDLLDEAMIQLRRREALTREKRRNWLIGAAVGAVLIVAIASTILTIQNKKSALANISVYQSLVTLNQDSGQNLTVINRQENPEVYYRVTLQAAPLGEKLALQCNWLDPNGNIAHQNSYQTKRIEREVWQTYCRYQLGNANIPGEWKVQMLLGDKLLSSSSFTVQ